MLATGGHEAWTAYEAGLSAASDQELLAYAAHRDAMVDTNNKDFVPMARRMRLACVVYLRVAEIHAVETMARALEWLDKNTVPQGMVLRVPRRDTIHVMNPLPW
jgi:predicted nuclease of predicted toxin-antitoxin system